MAVGYSDRIPPPDSLLGKHLKHVKDREASFKDIRASFGDSLEILPTDDGRVEIRQDNSSIAVVRLNYAEIVWLKKQLERIAG